MSGSGVKSGNPPWLLKNSAIVKLVIANKFPDSGRGRGCGGEGMWRGDVEGRGCGGGGDVEGRGCGGGGDVEGRGCGGGGDVEGDVEGGCGREGMWRGVRYQKWQKMYLS